MLGLELEGHTHGPVVGVAGEGPVAIRVSNDTCVVSVVGVGHLPRILVGIEGLAFYPEHHLAFSVAEKIDRPMNGAWHGAILRLGGGGIGAFPFGAHKGLIHKFGRISVATGLIVVGRFLFASNKAEGRQGHHARHE